MTYVIGHGSFLICHLSEYVLQRHLHRPPIKRGQDFTEVRIRERHVRIVRIYMVRHVECLSAELYGLLFSNPEHSRQAHVDIDTSRTENISLAKSSKCPRRRLREGRRIKPGLDAFVVGVRRNKHLVRPLVTSALRYC